MMNRIKKWGACFCVGLLCLLPIANAMASDTITSLGIAENTLKGLSHCVHYKVEGLCFWLRCTSIGCDTETTLKVNHYLPDAVVSVFTQPDNNPWLFSRNTEDPVFYRLGQQSIKQITHFSMGSGNESENSWHDLNNKFYEVDILGNPVLALLSNLDFLLPSAAQPYEPYYSSLLDAYAWRFPGLERYYAGSLVPGIHEVGTLGLHDWGPVYPRNGYVNQPNDAKAAAVDALRASTIITQPTQPHLYTLLTNDCGDHCTVFPVKENSRDAQYQLVYPIAEDHCVVFGGSDIARLPWESNASMKGHRRYIWVLWRHYHGCVPDHGAEYLGAVEF